MTATVLWEAEVRAGVDGQDRQRPGTWALDALHAAACHEATAREWEALGCASAADEYWQHAAACLAGELRRAA